MENPQIKVREIIRKLPEDIVRYIIPFTYSYQSPVLLQDIQSFYSDRKIVRDWYNHKWSIYLDNNPFEDIEWMANDIIIYVNHDQATMWGYHPFFHSICSRSFSLDSQEKQHRFIRAIIRCEVKPMRCFNVMWGLLNTDERLAFMHQFVLGA
jgi:hypothetical protein